MTTVRVGLVLRAQAYHLTDTVVTIGKWQIENVRLLAQLSEHVLLSSAGTSCTAPD